MTMSLMKSSKEFGENLPQTGAKTKRGAVDHAHRRTNCTETAPLSAVFAAPPWTEHGKACSLCVSNHGGDVSANSSSDPAHEPVVIKKYANRRLYDTGSSSYVTLEHLSEMVRRGVDFLVQDAKTGEDITRSVLAQIIFEQESRGQNMLPATFLRTLIRLYGDSLQSMLPTYLDMSMNAFVSGQERLREQVRTAFQTPASLSSFEEQTRKNMAVFEQAMRVWAPFAASLTAGAIPTMAGAAATPAPAKPQRGGEPEDATVAALRRQVEAMQRQLDELASEKAARKP
jgi:polyhydroxyalkanoate synthesis repressor PhaR